MLLRIPTYILYLNMCLENQVRIAQKEKKHVLALVNGVPGAGKTLLGIDLAYGAYNAELNTKSAYMSGNGAKDFDFNVCIFDEGLFD